MHVLVYWLARTALVFAVFVVLWGFGWRPVFAAVGAVAVAWLISYAMFGSMHDPVAKRMERWISRRFVAVTGDEVVEEPAGEARIDGKARAAAKPRLTPQARVTARVAPQPRATSRTASSVRATARATAKEGSARGPRSPR